MVDYPWGVDVHGYGIVVPWPLNLGQWPWPWESCGHMSAQGIDASVVISCMGITHWGRYALASTCGAVTFDLEAMALTLKILYHFVHIERWFLLVNSEYTINAVINAQAFIRKPAEWERGWAIIMTIFSGSVCECGTAQPLTDVVHDSHMQAEWSLHTSCRQAEKIFHTSHRQAEWSFHIPCSSQRTDLYLSSFLYGAADGRWGAFKRNICMQCPFHTTRKMGIY